VSRKPRSVALPAAIETAACRVAQPRYHPLHPVLVTREAATVDLLTEGRLQLGLGAGYVQSEYEQAGLDFDAGGIRVERLAEAVTLIKGLLKGEQVTLAGRHYRVTGHTIYPLPVQQPHPPILIGGNGRNLLTLAAREADIVGFSGRL
jgi:alkanesulfonate monooxygenase SsuD/methylene tetrahydromethanopterin reductase-like flavin-dependent oxidoreductase (luciferase family)